MTTHPYLEGFLIFLGYACIGVLIGLAMVGAREMVRFVFGGKK